MVAVDYWPQEEGYIVEGSPVMMCETAGTITEMACVEINNAGAAGPVLVDHGSNVGDSIGVALRADTVGGQMIPVAFGGIVKMLAAGAFVVQEPVISNGADTSAVIKVSTYGSNDLYFNAGTVWILGLALQAAVNVNDEVLILLAPQ